MKVKERNEQKELGTVELERRLRDAKQELMNLRFQLATRSLSNTSRMSEVRKQIARLNTLLRERQLGIR